MKSNRIKLLILSAIVLLNSIGFSLVLPMLPFLVAAYLPGRQVVVGMSALLSVFAACTFFAAPLLGALSDRYGRKKILIISLAGSVTGYVLFGIGGSLLILFLGRIIDGLTAGNISTIYAYIADSTDPKERTKWFGYIGSLMGIGKLGGPALGGMLGSISLSLPFYFTAGLIFMSMLGVFFFLPESLQAEKRTSRLTLNSMNSFSHFKEMFGLKGVGILLVSGVLFYAGIGIWQFNFTLFLKDVYEWGPVLIGSLLTLIGISEIVSRALLLPWLLKRINEMAIGKVGLVALGMGLTMILVSIYIHSAVLICLAVLCLIFGEGLFEPTYTGTLSQSVDHEKQGKLQGVNQSLQAANNTLIPLITGAVYFYSAATVYLIAAVLVMLAFFIYKRVASPSTNTSEVKINTLNI